MESVLQDLLPGRQGLMVRLQARGGARPALLDALHRYMDRLAEAEPSTEAMVLSLDPQDESVVWLFEWFTDEQGQIAHRSSQPFAELTGELSTMLAADPAILVLEPMRVHINYRPTD